MLTPTPCTPRIYYLVARGGRSFGRGRRQLPKDRVDLGTYPEKLFLPMRGVLSEGKPPAH